MMTSNKKRFHSGTEVFEEFIPDYEQRSSPPQTEGVDTRVDASETAQRLLTTFKSNLKASVKGK